MKKKKIIIMILIIIIAIIVSTISVINLNKDKNQDESKKEENINNQVVQEEQEEKGVELTGKLVEEQSTEHYKISNIKMTAKSKETEIILTIKNISEKEQKERDVYVSYYDQQNNEIGKTRIHLPKMDKEKEITLSAIIAKDLSNAIKYIIEY